MEKTYSKTTSCKVIKCFNGKRMKKEQKIWGKPAKRIIDEDKPGSPYGSETYNRRK